MPIYWNLAHEIGFIEQLREFVGYAENNIHEVLHLNYSVMLAFHLKINL